MSEIKSKTLDYWINLARDIAIRAHDGQFRNDKVTPYIKHCEAVANAVEKRLQPIAWLHDVVEDTTVTLQDLIDDGFPQYIIDAVEVLTHLSSDTNPIYWAKIADNVDAVAVKLKDIQHNSSDTPSQYAQEKYARAIKFFADRGFSI